CFFFQAEDGIPDRNVTGVQTCALPILALVSLGYSMNTTSSIKLHLAQTKLNSLGPNIKAIISDEMKMYLVQNEAAIGVTWSGEAYEMMEQNPHLHYVVPKQGSNLWFDNFVIPKTVQN